MYNTYQQGSNVVALHNQKGFKMNIETRIKAEQSIIKTLSKLVFSIDNSKGTYIYVSDDEHTVACENPSQVWAAVSGLDECYITVENLFTGKTLAQFFIVLGNDGYDCICDHSTNEFTTKVMAQLEPTIQKWENKLC